MTEISRVSIQW